MNKIEETCSLKNGRLRKRSGFIYLFIFYFFFGGRGGGEEFPVIKCNFQRFERQLGVLCYMHVSS